MPDILTDERIAAIAARWKRTFSYEGDISRSIDVTVLFDIPALLASHAALTAEVARLRKALQTLASIAGNEIAEEPENFRLLVAMQQIARDALTEQATDAHPEREKSPSH